MTECEKASDTQTHSGLPNVVYYDKTKSQHQFPVFVHSKSSFLTTFSTFHSVLLRIHLLAGWGLGGKVLILEIFHDFFVIFRICGFGTYRKCRESIANGVWVR